MSANEKKIIASGVCDENIKWGLDDEGMLNISGTGELNQNCSSKWEKFKDKINKVIIKDGITQIGKEAFENFTIESITVPKSVLHIKDDAFCNCISRKSRIDQITRSVTINVLGQLQPRVPFVPLEDEFLDVYYNGTKEEWNRIDYNGYGVIVHCTDGDIICNSENIT